MIDIKAKGGVKLTQKLVITIEIEGVPEGASMELVPHLEKQLYDHARTAVLNWELSRKPNLQDVIRKAQ